MSDSQRTLDKSYIEIFKVGKHARTVVYFKFRSDDFRNVTVVDVDGFALRQGFERIAQPYYIFVFGLLSVMLHGIVFAFAVNKNTRKRSCVVDFFSRFSRYFQGQRLDFKRAVFVRNAVIVRNIVEIPIQNGDRKLVDCRARVLNHGKLSAFYGKHMIIRRAVEKLVVRILYKA